MNSMLSKQDVIDELALLVDTIENTVDELNKPNTNEAHLLKELSDKVEETNDIIWKRLKPLIKELK